MLTRLQITRNTRTLDRLQQNQGQPGNTSDLQWYIWGPAKTNHCETLCTAGAGEREADWQGGFQFPSDCHHWSKALMTQISLILYMMGYQDWNTYIYIYIYIYINIYFATTILRPNSANFWLCVLWSDKCVTCSINVWCAVESAQCIVCSVLVQVQVHVQVQYVVYSLQCTVCSPACHRKKFTTLIQISPIKIFLLILDLKNI